MEFEEIKRKCGPVFEKYGIIIAYLFGSVARGTAGTLSDIDIAFYKYAFTDSLENKLYGDLSHTLKRNDIDLVNLERASSLLKHRAILKGKPLTDMHPYIRAQQATHALREFEYNRHLYEIKRKAFLGV